jgi:hypothetical protein
MVSIQLSGSMMGEFTSSSGDRQVHVESSPSGSVRVTVKSIKVSSPVTTADIYATAKNNDDGSVSVTIEPRRDSPEALKAPESENHSPGGNAPGDY